MPETDRLWNTLCQWWTEIEVLIVTGVTNARTEAANTSIKNIKRTGRGFRNPANYKARILLRSASKCLAPGLMEALNPREDESHGGTEEVPRGASGAGDPVGGRGAA